MAFNLNGPHPSLQHAVAQVQATPAPGNSRYNPQTGQVEFMDEEQIKEWEESRYAPIDPMWEKAQTWSALSSKPSIAAMVHDNRTDYFVITGTRAWTHRTFVALVGQYKWYVNPTPSMKNSLYEESVYFDMVGLYFTKQENEQKLFKPAPAWWGRCMKELQFNCKEWLDSFEPESQEDNAKLLKYLDPMKPYQSVEAPAFGFRTDNFSSKFTSTEELPTLDIGGITRYAAATQTITNTCTAPRTFQNVRALVTMQAQSRAFRKK